MNMISPPPDQGSPVAERSEDRVFVPAALPVRPSAGRQILAVVVLLILAGTLGVGFWQHHSLHAEVMATAQARRDLVPSVRTVVIRASDGRLAGNDGGLRTGETLRTGERQHLQAHRRYRQPGNFAVGVELRAI